jgi:hypothetical protein
VEVDRVDEFLLAAEAAICWIFSGGMRRGRPTAVRPASPFPSPCCRSRFSHRRTVCRTIPNCSAICCLALPAAKPSMIFARSAARTATVRLAAQHANSFCWFG